MNIELNSAQEVAEAAGNTDYHYYKYSKLQLTRKKNSISNFECLLIRKCFILF